MVGGMSIWTPEVAVAEKVLRAAVVYLFLLADFRLTGKRQIGQLTPFDLVVLLIISNVVQNAMIGKDDSITGGLIGAATVLSLNYLVVRLAIRSRKVERLLGSAPTLLVYDGKVIEEHPKRELISHQELLAALRREGLENPHQVRLAVLEANGTISVIKREGA